MTADLTRQIVNFCSPQERSFWDLWNKFDKTGGRFQMALKAALDAQQITRRQAPDGYHYRTAFPGVDIDRVHLIRQPQAQAA